MNYNHLINRKMTDCSVLLKLKETRRYLPCKYVGKEFEIEQMNQYLLDFKLKYNNVLFILSTFYFRDFLGNSMKECSDGK